MTTTGSSPLSRGIHTSANKPGVLYGIIPALAGNTRGGRAASCRRADHPRSRGEYSMMSVRMVVVFGSSPLSRGILAQAVWRGLQTGIIPALAGNTGALG